MVRWICTALAVASAVFAASAAAQNVDEALQRIATHEFGQSREPLTVVADMVTAAMPDPARRAELAGKLAALLSTNATFECKQFVCRQLALIGGAESIPALRALLDNAATANIARYPLERIPIKEAGDALLAALPGADPATKIGLINSLGERRDGEAVDELAGLLASGDAALVEPAVAALGKIGGPKAVAALSNARAGLPAALKPVAADALLSAAGALEASGDVKAAVDVYASLFQESEPAPVRVAAFRGLVTAKGADGADLVLDALSSTDPLLQRTAVTFMRDLPGKGMTKALAKALKDMTPQTQVATLSALAARGDNAAFPAVLAASKSEEEQVRVAALNAMADLGSAPAALVLARRAAQTKGVEQIAARKSLQSLRGEKTNEAILRLARRGAPEVRAELIKAMAARNMTEAVPLLAKWGKSGKGVVQNAALGALGDLARAGDLPDLLALLLSVKGEEARAAAGKAVVRAARAEQTDAVRRSALEGAWAKAATPDAKGALLSAMGKIGDDAFIETLRANAEAADASLRDAAIRGLSEWPTPAALEDVRALARSSGNDVYRVLGLRGYVRMLGLDANRSAADTLAGYTEALGLAQSADEKKTVLAGLAKVRQPEALDLAVPALDDEALRAEAAAAIVQIASAVCGAAPKQAEAACAQVVAKTSDERLQARAKEVLDTIKSSQGYVTAWQVSGPYAQEGVNGEALFDVAFPPEDPAASDAVWAIVPSDIHPDKPWYVDLNHLFGGDNRVAYLRTIIESQAEQDAQVEFGSDDGAKIWLNGELVHAVNTHRGCTPGEDTFGVRLKQGGNALLVKVVDRQGGWAACMRLCAPDGQPLETVSARIPE